MTHEITEMQTVERDMLDKISTPTASMPKPALRPPQPSTALNPGKKALNLRPCILSGRLLDYCQLTRLR
jgi:hypothetical protein